MPQFANLAANIVSRIPENWPKTLRQLLAALDTKAQGILTAQAGVGNGADTTEDVLATFPLPANTFGALPLQTTGLYIYAAGRMAANADVKTVRLYFGAEVIASPAAATNGKNWFLELFVTRTGLSTQRVTGAGQVDITAITVLDTTGAESEVAAVTIKCTGQAGTATANDIICDQLIVEAMN